MKRSTRVLFVIAALTSVMLIGYGAGPAAAQKLPKDFIVVASGSGNSYGHSVFFTEMITRQTSMVGQVHKTAGSTEDISTVLAGKAFLNFTSPTTPSKLCKNSLAKGKSFKLRAVMSAGGAASSAKVNFYTLPRDDIKTWKDLKGKRVYADKPNIAWAKPISETLLKVNGMTKKDIVWLSYLKPRDAFRDVKEGRVAAIIYVGGSATTEMSETTGIYIIPYTPEEQKAIEDLGFGFKADIWPAGVAGSKVDTPSVLAGGACWTYADAPANVIKKTLDVFYGSDEFQKSLKTRHGYTLKNALTQWALPYHSAAIEWYRNKGMWGAAEDAKQKKLIDYVTVK